MLWTCRSRLRSRPATCHKDTLPLPSLPGETVSLPEKSCEFPLWKRWTLAVCQVIFSQGPKARRPVGCRKFAPPGTAKRLPAGEKHKLLTCASKRPVAASGHVAHRIQCFNMLQLPCPASLFVPTSTANFCIEMIPLCQLSNDFSALKSMVVHHPPWKASSVRTWTDSIAGSWRYAMTSDWGRVVPLQGSLEWVYYHHLHICIYIYI